MPAATHATIAIERTYKATPARVFAAWADPAAKRLWFAEGEHWEVRSFDLDFREGGRETSRFLFLAGEKTFGEETVFGNETIFHDIAPDQRLIFSYAMLRNEVRFSISLACVELHAEGAGTRLVFTEHAIFLEGADGPAMREAGWRELLAKLAAHLER